MSKTIDYYMSPMSPWTYLGHDRLAKIARAHGVQIAVKPVDFGKVFPLSGGLPLPKRAPQRQKYRLVELRRWKAFLGVPLTIEPKFFPYDASLASRLIVVAAKHGEQAAMSLAGAILRGCWVEERNMADEGELAASAKAAGLDAANLLAEAKMPEAAAKYDALTNEAVNRDVFGAPTYVYNDELFWGQDRLELLDWRLTTSP